MLEKIFSDEFFVLAKTARIDFPQMVELVHEATKETTKEIHAASIIEQKLREKITKSNKHIK